MKLQETKKKMFLLTRARIYYVRPVCFGLIYVTHTNL